jgi:hypothetical protein
MHRRHFLTLALAGAVCACVPGAGLAQSATPTASGELVQVTLDVQGMH